MCWRALGNENFFDINNGLMPIENTPEKNF